MRFVLACCLAIAACAQDAPGNNLFEEMASRRVASLDLARRLIADPRPLSKALAADLVRRNGDAYYLHKELLAALGDPNTLASDRMIEDNERRLHLAILDALIQLKAEIPPEIGRALLNRYPAQATILLYGNGCPDLKTSTFILDNSRSDEAWLVAASCLPAIIRGGTVELLRRFRMSAQLKVFDPNRGEGNYIRGVPGYASGGVRGQVGSGLPEVHGYRLMTGLEAMSGAVVLRPGVHAVYYERGGDFQPTQSHRDRNEDLLDFLTNLVGTGNNKMGLEAHPSTELPWFGAGRYRSDVETFVADQRRR